MVEGHDFKFPTCQVGTFATGLLHKRAACSSSTTNIDLGCLIFQMHQRKLFHVSWKLFFTPLQDTKIYWFKSSLSDCLWFLFLHPTTDIGMGGQIKWFIPVAPLTGAEQISLVKQNPVGSAEVSRGSCEPRTPSTVNTILWERTRTGLWAKKLYPHRGYRKAQRNSLPFTRQIPSHRFASLILLQTPRFQMQTQWMF